EAGADVVLVERYGFLGGNATAALVMPMMSFHTQEQSPKQPGDTRLLPTDHGQGSPVIAGVLERLVKRLVEMGGAIPPSLHTGYVVPFDPEIFKMAAFELLDGAGVKFLLHAFASDMISADAMSGVVFETKTGPIVIRARAVVDCTGDGDVAALAGAPYEVGRENNGLTQPLTLMFRMMGFERSHFDAYVKEHPDQWYGVHGLWELISKATANGELDLPREDMLFFGTPHQGEVSVNSTRVTKVLGTDIWDLTYAEWQGRRQMRQIADFLRRYVPGFEKAYIGESALTVGVRGTRRIMGEYSLTEQDVLEARKFDDVIARGSYPIDIHNPEGKGTLIKRLPRGEAYDIPLRSLIPQAVDGLIVAGRCMSGTFEALASYRAMPICMATGQAAGVCAALAVRLGKPPRAVAPGKVQAELLRQGANLRNVG
ncbi:MAG: FAD-dependent oxidoreductase, partial [Chloroflexota bacterium]